MKTDTLASMHDGLLLVDLLLVDLLFADRHSDDLPNLLE